MDEASNKVHTSLPANYVTLVDLKERWMQQQKAKKGDEEIREKERDPNSKVQGEGVGVGDGNQQDKKHQAPENSRLQSNPNPRLSTRRPSHGNRRPIESGNQTKRASVVESKQLKPLPPPVVQKIGAKEAPANRIIQSKPPQLDSPKVESCGEIHSSGKIAQKKTPRRNNKINDEKKVMDQSPPEKCATENTEQGFDAGKVNKDADDNNGDDKIVQKKKPSRNNKRNDQKKVVYQSPLEECAKENPEQGFEAGKKKPSRNNKRNDEKKVVYQSPPEECAKENPEQGFEAGKVNKDADHKTGADKIVQKKKPSRRNNKRNDEKKDVDQSPPEKCPKENPEQGFEAGKVNKDADDNTGAEIVGRIAGVSLSSRTWEKSGCKSMAVRYQRPLRKEKVGGYGKFEGRFMLNKDRARSANGLVWVKKGEASLIGAVQMEETGFHK